MPRLLPRPSGQLRGQRIAIFRMLPFEHGFAKVKWPARFEVVRREPPVIFDSAHNQDSFARLRQALDDYFPGRQVYLIFGASEDKNIPGMFSEIKPKVKRMFVTKSIHPRALDPRKYPEVGGAGGHSE